MKFNPRILAAILITTAVIAPLVTRPLYALVTSQTGRDMLSHFSVPFRHLAWLVGFEVSYPNVNENSPMFICLLFGIIVSIVLHLVTIVAVGTGLGALWAWATKKPPKRFL